MNGIETLERIKRSEEAARILVSRAEEEYSKSIGAAQNKAAEILSKAEVRAKLAKEAAYAHAKKDENDEVRKMEAEHNNIIEQMGRVDRKAALYVFEYAVRSFLGK